MICENYPFIFLSPKIKNHLITCLSGQYLNDLKAPKKIKVISSSHYNSYNPTYVVDRYRVFPVEIKIDLKNDKAVLTRLINMNIPNKNVTLSVNDVVFKANFNEKNYLLINSEIYFHENRAPKVFEKTQISDRDLEIMKCFHFLKNGFLRKQQLLGLNVSSLEMKELSNRGLLRSCGFNYELTKLGKFNIMSVV